MYNYGTGSICNERISYAMSFSGIITLLKNIKLREKILINYLLVCIIPLIVITVLNYSVSMSNTRETMTAFINLFSSQLSSEIENYVASIDNISKTIVNDDDILRFLSKEKEYLLSDRILYRNVIYEYLYNMALQKPEVQNIFIIGASTIVYSSGNQEQQQDYKLLEKEEWFKKIHNSGGNLILTPIDSLKSTGRNNDKSLFVIGRVLKDVHGTVHGTIAFVIELQNIIRTNSIQDRIINEYDIGMEVLNSSGEHIYNIPSKSIDMSGDIGDQAVAISNRSSKYGLSISILVPGKKLFHKIDLLRNLTFVLVVVMLFMSLILSLFLSHTITKPLSRLVSSMKLFQKKQQYDYIPTTDRTDEIGTLTETYNKMIAKINTLINEVYASKLKEKQAQFVALQNQMNPHMLYNTIENIRMRAVLNNDLEVSDMIKDFGKIFRLILSKGKKDNTIGDEVEYIIIYINLLNIRHDNRYILKIKIPEELMEANIIRFAFQPIIENSIVHGFKNPSGDCIINIDAALVQNDVKILIKDNGEGIRSERLAEIKQKLAKSSNLFEEVQSNIGLQNVYDRIKLQYEEKYFLDIQSEYMKGTTVEMLIPFGRR